MVPDTFPAAIHSSLARRAGQAILPNGLPCYSTASPQPLKPTALRNLVSFYCPALFIFAPLLLFSVEAG